MIWFIEVKSFLVWDVFVFVGDDDGLHTFLDELSAAGWMSAAAYELDVTA